MILLFSDASKEDGELVSKTSSSWVRGSRKKKTSARDVCHALITSCLPKQIDRSHHGVAKRQHHGGCIHKQRGRENIIFLVLACQTNASMGQVQFREPDSSLHPRTSECDSGPTQLSWPGDRDKVVPSSCGHLKSVLDLEDSSSGLDCISSRTKKHVCTLLSLIRWLGRRMRS